MHVHKNIYTNDSILGFIAFFRDQVLISKKISLVKTKLKNMRTFHIKPLFQATTKSYPIHGAGLLCRNLFQIASIYYSIAEFHC